MFTPRGVTVCVAGVAMWFVARLIGSAGLEVVGRDHGATDRSFQPQLYARSRIPYSLLIDHDGPFAVAEMIISGRYHEYATAGSGGPLVLDEPFRLTLDLDAMTARGTRPEASAPAASCPSRVPLPARPGPGTH